MKQPRAARKNLVILIVCRTLLHCSLDVLMFIICCFGVVFRWNGRNNGNEVWADLVFHCTKVSSAPIHAIKFSEVINRSFLRIFFFFGGRRSQWQMWGLHMSIVCRRLCVRYIFCLVLTTFMTFFCSFMVFCIRVLFMLCKAFIWPLESMRTHVGPNEH